MTNHDTTDADGQLLDLDQLAAESTHEPYRFRLGGRVRTLPHVMDAPVNALDKIMRGDVVVGVGLLRPWLTDHDDEQLADDLETLSAAVMRELFDRWTAAGGVDLGGG